MRFLANGDFNFPFEWAIYWMKHFYIWSFQSGTPNPDGLIRLPGRIFNFIIFGLFGNMGASYFYLFSSLAIAFVAFYFFAKHFLEIKQRSVLLIGALFFAINPIFLGNLAKVGLVLAAAMLPLCLLAIKSGFTTRRMRYFLLFFACLNISFLHPYTFTVNAVVSGLYFAYMAWMNRAFLFKKLHVFIILGIFGLLLNAYFVLPLASMGTVSKDVISDNVVPTAQDYTALVNVSNTGDLFTGLSLSKNVFLDFNFYDGSYQIIYFLGVFAFYMLLIALYVGVEKKLTMQEKRRAALFFAAFLVFVALATTTFMHLDVLIKFLIGMPGGWAFRSPLKWQLYIPLVLFGVLVMLLARVTDRVRLGMFQAALVIIFFMMNSYVAVDVFKKILTPRTFENFASLANTDLDQKTLLFVNNNECMDYMRAHPRVTTELTQVFISKQVQVKRVLADSIGGINVGSYDYVLGCKLQPALAKILVSQYSFKKAEGYRDDTFRLYKNQAPLEPVYTTDDVLGLTGTQRIADKYQFVHEALEGRLNFIDLAKDQAPWAPVLQDIFEEVKSKSIKKGSITASLSSSGKGREHLFIQNQDAPLFYRIEGSRITLSGSAERGMQAIEGGPNNVSKIDLPARPGFDITLLDSTLSAKNLVRNPSLEDGLWQSKVSDCYAYDDRPDIAMKLSRGQRTDGEQAIQLEARRHIACSGPNPIAVQPGDHYLLNFDYQSIGKRYAGYQITFDDPKHTFMQERLPGFGDGWQTFSREVAVPEGAIRLKLMLYAYPDGSDGLKTTTARYDNLHIYKTPALQDRFYLLSESARPLKTPRQTDYTIVDPTKKIARIKGADQPFLLATSETYNALWKLSFAGTGNGAQNPLKAGIAPAGTQHLQLNGTMNAWYIDPVKACQTPGANCTKHTDGSYDFTLNLTFAPQRWFYVGGLISLAAIICASAYFIYDHKRDRLGRERRKGAWRWK